MNRKQGGDNFRVDEKKVYDLDGSSVPMPMLLDGEPKPAAAKPKVTGSINEWPTSLIAAACATAGTVYVGSIVAPGYQGEEYSPLSVPVLGFIGCLAFTVHQWFEALRSYPARHR